MLNYGLSPGGFTIQYEPGSLSIASTSESLCSGIVKESERKSKCCLPYFCCILLKLCHRLSFLAIWWHEGKGEVFTW